MKESPKAMDKTDNELIAEFMGLHFDESGQCTDLERKYSWRPGVYDPLKVEHLQYDTSWAWLMPVVEKIESLRYDTRIQWFTSTADYGDMHCMSIETWHEVTIIYQKSQTKIEAVYKAVVEFIKWFNSQNNGQ